MVQASGRFLFLCTIITAASLGSNALYAEDLSEEGLFHRCYTHLTGMRPALNHSMLGKVKAGQSTALEECGKLLDHTKLNPSSGALVNDAISENERLAVLNNLHRFHGSWFVIKSFSEPNQTVQHAQIFDSGESGLYVSRSFFTNEPYDIILTSNKVPMALRENIGRDIRRLSYDRQGSTELDIDLDPIVSSSTSSILVQEGGLKGIRWRTGSHVFNLKNQIPTLPADLKNNMKNAFNNVANLNLQKSDGHYGAGILGLPSYYAMNFGKVGKSNGAGVHSRGWARNLISDLLCRDIPVIRLDDLKPNHHVNPNSNISYRTDRSCMRCHATIDPMGSTTRNFDVQSVTHILGRNRIYYSVLKTNPSMGYKNIFSINSESGDPDFNKYNPTGELYMRSFDGILIDKTVNNISDLANALLDTEDLYVCAARRYFDFFTGIKVSLQDVGDQDLPELHEGELHYREIVAKLGRDFKSHKNLKKLVKAIWALPLYRANELRVLQEEQ